MELEDITERTIDYWLDHVGSKADISNGDLVISEGGWLTVSTSPTMNTVYVDSVKNIVAPVVPKEEWRGRKYRFFFRDCISLVAEWLDATYNIGAVAHVRTVTRGEYVRLNMNGYEHMLEQFGFAKVDQPCIRGDIVFYERLRHIGVCIEDGQLLHHPINKFSCVDPIDLEKVLGVYRRAN
jgi:hypothetical protein